MKSVAEWVDVLRRDGITTRRASAAQKESARKQGRRETSSLNDLLQGNGVEFVFRTASEGQLFFEKPDNYTYSNHNKQIYLHTRYLPPGRDDLDLSQSIPAVLRVLNDDRYHDREVEVLQLLAEHPNIVQLLDRGIYNEYGRYQILVRERTDLHTEILQRKVQTFSPTDILRGMRDVTRAVQAVYDTGWLYLDLKPENVLVGWDGRLRLCDFEMLAEKTGKNEIYWSHCITPRHQPPESRGSLGVGEFTLQSTVYQLGVLFHSLLTAKIKRADYGIDEKRIRELHPYWIDVLTKAIARQPKDRYKTPTEFYQAIEQVYIEQDIQQMERT